MEIPSHELYVSFYNIEGNRASIIQPSKKMKYSCQMKNYLIIIVLSIVIFSCKHKEDTKVIPVDRTDTIVTEKQKAKDTLLNQQTRDTIRMIVHDTNGNYSAIGTIDSIHSKIYVKFSNKISGNLKGKIITMNGDGNIRFNQILFPDKTADGPFGKELILKLRQIGEYTLIVGHSQMADGQYQGKFKVEVELN